MSIRHMFKQTNGVRDDMHSQRILTPEDYPESLLNLYPTLILVCLLVADWQEEGETDPG